MNEYPKKVNNTLVWACCDSTIGPKCRHQYRPTRKPKRASSKVRLIAEIGFIVSVFIIIVLWGGNWHGSL